VVACIAATTGPAVQVETNADGRADDVRLSDIEPGFVCSVCGKRGAEMSSGLDRGAMI
jgi:hypothetical protein